MASLCRVETSGFPIEKSYTLDELEQLDSDTLKARLLPIEALFSGLTSLAPPQFYVGLSRNGCVMYQKKIGTCYDIGTRVAFFDKDGFFAVGEVREYEGGSAIKPIRQFS